MTVIASKDLEHCPGLEIRIHRELHSPTDLITAKWAPERWTGMVSLAQYWQWHRQEYGFRTHLTIRGLEEALPYALHQAINLLRTSEYSKITIWPASRTFQQATQGPDADKWWSAINQEDDAFVTKGVSQILQPLQVRLGLTEEESLSLVASPFPTDAIVANMLCKFLGLSTRVELRPLPAGTRLVGLPTVALYVADLKKACACDTCGDYAKPRSGFRKCDVNFFFDRLAIIVADILSLSLFELPDNLLVRLTHHRRRDLEFKAAIHSIITTGRPFICDISHILKWTLALIGHEIEVGTGKVGDQKEWVLSSEKGQVVYPKIFETHNITRRGYLALSWTPGVLRYRNQIYTKGVSQPSPSSGRNPVTQGNETLQVDKPRNLLPTYKLAWLVAQGDGYLEISVSLRNEIDQRTSGNERPDDFSFYTGPLAPIHPKLNSPDWSKIRCVAVEGNGGLALLALGALSAPFSVVVRGNACLKCALKVCRRSRYEVLIL